MKQINLPENVAEIMKSLEKAGFEAFIVGGCVRDLLLGKEPKDWDIATSAKPEEILRILPDSVYENDFGTVVVKIRNPKAEVQKTEVQKDDNMKGNVEIVEITTYRIESKYSDRRHPDEVRFAKTLEEDLSRRDFTINAMALKVKSENKNSKAKKIEEDYDLIDLYDGQSDLKEKIIRAVGDPNERFNEDALRMMRAIRFAVALGTNSKSKIQIKKSWEVEEKTFVAIKKNSRNLKYVSQERIRDEFEKIILSPWPARGIEMLVEADLIEHIIPELKQAIGVKQNRHHYYGPFNTVYKHLLASLEKCPSEKIEVRLAALLHDIGKPKSKRGDGEGATFHGHEYIGEKMTRRILERLRFSRNIVEKTVLLVRSHMFYYNVSEVGEAGVRRVIRKVGLENINDLIDVRIADRLGSGVPKAVPYKLRHFRFMVEKVSQDPLSVKQLKLNGRDLMNELKLSPGPKIGAILEILLAEAIENPQINTRPKLLVLARKFSDQEMEKLREIARHKIAIEKKQEEDLIKKKYWVD